MPEINTTNVDAGEMRSVLESWLADKRSTLQVLEARVKDIKAEVRSIRDQLDFKVGERRGGPRKRKQKAEQPTPDAESATGGNGSYDTEPFLQPE